MRILLEAHHPAHVHFWKYPVRELQARGHEVRMIARDRDVMRRLLEVYDWIDAEIPPRRHSANRFPILEMLQRQWTVARAIRRFKPNVVASLMGSYTQSSKLFGVRNVIFTDTETQAFNHLIAHPFADKIFTPECFLKDFGPKQVRYAGLHELSYLNTSVFQPSDSVLRKYRNLSAGNYVIIRLSAWNTLHDCTRSGIGQAIYEFVDFAREHYEILISAEEGKVPPGLESYATSFAPEDFHDLLAKCRFVLTEGASTSSEAACLGVPSVFINSVGDLGNFKLLAEDYHLIRRHATPATGIPDAIEWLTSLGQGKDEAFEAEHRAFLGKSIDVSRYVTKEIAGA